MKKLTFSLCALMVMLSVNAAPQLNSIRPAKDAQKSELKQNVIAEKVAHRAVISAGNRVSVNRAPKAVMENIAVTATQLTSRFYAADNDAYYVLGSNDYNFYFDIVVVDGLQDVEPGHTYTLADMLTDYSYMKVLATNAELEFTAASFVRTLDAITGAIRIEANVTANDGNVYNVVYSYTPPTPGDTVEVAISTPMSMKYDAENGDWYLSGKDGAYQVALDVVNNDPTTPAGTYTTEDFLLNYTKVNDGQVHNAVEANAVVSLTGRQYNVDAYLTDGNGVIWHVTMGYQVPAALYFDTIVATNLNIEKQTFWGFSLGYKVTASNADYAIEFSIDADTAGIYPASGTITNLITGVVANTYSGGITLLYANGTLAVTGSVLCKNDVEYNLILTCQQCVKYIVNVLESANGHIDISDYTTNDTIVTVSAIPSDGYHFVEWNDGNSDNPRNIHLTSDTTIGAIFAQNPVITYLFDSTQGFVSGNTTTPTGIAEDSITFEAIPNYGYHFVQWNDGNIDNPRSIYLTNDTTIGAIFAKNIIITYLYNSIQGYVSGNTTTSTGVADSITFEAIPNYGYHFVQWNDGNIENPRTIFLSKDTTFGAEFAVDKFGTCGNNQSLQWEYDAQTSTLTISGSGSLTSNYTYGIEAPAQMQNLIIGNDVTGIGQRAFYGMTTINHLTIGGNVTSIGDYAFAECRNFDDITCYAYTVPTITASTFANVGNKQYIYLFVPQGRQRAYLRDQYWGEFDVQVKGADPVTTGEDVTVIPSDNTAAIIWPAVDDAATYEIEITVNGTVVCTLTFNSQGYLTGIAFIPGRDGAAYTQQTQTTGFSFTVTGLNSNTLYGYSVAAKDVANTTLDTKSGSFETTGGVVTELESTEMNTTPQKIIHEGKIYILRDGKVYSLQGQEVIRE